MSAVPAAAYVVLPITKLPGADVLGRHALHLVGQDQRRGRKLIVVILRHVDAAPPDADVVRVVHVLDGDVDLVRPGRSGSAFQ